VGVKESFTGVKESFTGVEKNFTGVVNPINIRVFRARILTNSPAGTTLY
jgi:hypothetical protein